MSIRLEPTAPIEEFSTRGGGKATNLARLSQMKDIAVPPWFCLTTEAFALFLAHHNLRDKLSFSGDAAAFAKYVEELFLPLPLLPEVEQSLRQGLRDHNLEEGFVAVRSSGAEEDSPEFSFAGQFSTFLYQKGIEQITTAVKRCWASAYSERCISYRQEHELPLDNIAIAVIIQKMVDAEVSGVAFSRHPVRPSDWENLLISSTWGLGEGLVSGELDADHFEVNRKTLQTTPTIVDKHHALQLADGGGVTSVSVPEEKRQVPSLSKEQVATVAELVMGLERHFDSPQDCEWAYDNNTLYCLQTRPITNLPPSAYYSATVNGNKATLWDNSNIVESYSGVTSPLTFTFASNAYRRVYRQTCEVLGIPTTVIEAHETEFRNLLGLIRGLPGSLDQACDADDRRDYQIQENLNSIFHGLDHLFHSPLPSAPLPSEIERRMSVSAWTLRRR